MVKSVRGQETVWTYRAQGYPSVFTSSHFLRQNNTLTLDVCFITPPEILAHLERVHVSKACASARERDLNTLAAVRVHVPAFALVKFVEYFFVPCAKCRPTSA